MEKNIVQEREPTLYMLIGVPASGKSFWYKTNVGDITKDLGKVILLSTDNIIERIGYTYNMTYDELFHSSIGMAQTVMANKLVNAKKFRNNIIWDQTNLTVKSRAKKLAKLPEYKKIAVYFKTPETKVHDARLDSRVVENCCKTIPRPILKKMIHSLEEPSLDEGFDSIIVAE